MKRTSGFTLIELVIVIIILGILAVTAAPKFIDLQSDARESTLKGLEAAVKGGANLVYSKSALQGLESSSSAQDTDVDGTNVKTIFGYPANESFNSTAVVNWVDMSISTASDTGDWEFVTEGADGTEGVVKPAGFSGTGCTLTYKEATSGSLATVELDVSQC
ncbi:prepilin-type N-terminal cleavage/methylation domain-containing protein [Alginatibacterium sediminis]|uniref:Prepilin-type N-terminal cleavage/methylation domain-containing protein n=1 Tax=Alginatibacterium sediminis TaxID=2164068 RepID=A0A420EKX3_9ALTE|nr:prepilin-type N-terminal cleavage/methylation domain-containing protein [Alginatibacterium sediminis]RKF21371.1 prepilin-type N-terminal cleavage/methylation domain-containing protein [Alginatibacterium sediminis]